MILKEVPISNTLKFERPDTKATCINTNLSYSSQRNTPSIDFMSGYGKIESTLNTEMKIVTDCLMYK